MHKLLIVTVLAVIILSACGAPAPAPTAVPPTAVPPTAVPPTAVPPTATPTPDPALTTLMDVAEKFKGEGYIPSTEGEMIRFNDLEDSFAQLKWYQRYPLEDPAKIGDFVYTAHFTWSTATNTSDMSGCGIMFGNQENGDHYVMFVDKSRILFLMTENGSGFEVGKTKGTGKLAIAGPTFEADVNVAVSGGHAYVNVNGEFIGDYTLSKNTTGQFGHAIISGTNKDYGTRCSVTNAALLMLK